MSTETVKITDSAIERYQQTGVRQLRDPRYPLYVRFHANGETASWYLTQNKGGKTKWHRQGAWPGLSAKKFLPQVPERIADMVAKSQIVTDHFEFTSQVLGWYLARQQGKADLSPERKSTIQSAINCHLTPRIGGLRLEHIDRIQLDEKLIQPLQAVLSLSYVRQCYTVLKAAFRQARKLKMVRVNPLADFSLSDFLQEKPKPKTARLKGRHAAQLLLDIQAAPMPRQMLALLQLLHGTRITETRLLRWEWIDWDDDCLELPGEITKNRQPLTLPLTDQSRALLKQYRAWQKKRGYTGGLLFPGRNRRQPVTRRTVQDWYKAISSGQWTSHDLRKLARTRWAKMGIDHHVGEQLVNHKSGEIVATYVQDALSKQKRKALKRWHEWLVEKGLDVGKPGP